MDKLYSYSLLTLWDIHKTIAESINATFCETLAYP